MTKTPVSTKQSKTRQHVNLLGTNPLFSYGPCAVLYHVGKCWSWCCLCTVILETDGMLISSCQISGFGGQANLCALPNSWQLLFYCPLQRGWGSLTPTARHDKDASLDKKMQKKSTCEFTWNQPLFFYGLCTVLYHVRKCRSGYCLCTVI